MIFPECQCIALTPVAPRSLSFRPIVVPANSFIQVSESPSNRYHDIIVSFDGRHTLEMKGGDRLKVSELLIVENLV